MKRRFLICFYNIDIHYKIIVLTNMYCSDKSSLIS